MDQKSESRWMKLSTTAFSFNFAVFAFLMFSCILPTGFLSVFSTLAFLSALPFVFNQLNELELDLITKYGLLLFGFLAISIAWSEASLFESFIYLMEYRIFIMLPVFIWIFSFNIKALRLSVISSISGLTVALLASYGLGYGWLVVDGAQYSLGNTVYHGFTMGFFLLISIFFTRETKGITRLFLICLCVAIIYNVLNIENGRTGYILVSSVVFFFLAMTLSRKYIIPGLILAMALLVVSYFNLDRFNSRFNETVTDIVNMVDHDNLHSSAGYRLEFYRGALTIARDYPLLGVGIGDAENSLNQRWNAGEMRVFTDNVHSEWMNMLIIGGTSGVFLFFLFIVSIVRRGFAYKIKERYVGDILIGTGMLIGLSSVFNSTLKDYGEKHALLIILGITCAYVVGRENNRFGAQKSTPYTMNF